MKALYVLLLNAEQKRQTSQLGPLKLKDTRKMRLTKNIYIQLIKQRLKFIGENLNHQANKRKCMYIRIGTKTYDIKSLYIVINKVKHLI